MSSVDALLGSLSIEEKIGQTLCWFISRESEEEIEAIAKAVPVGSVFLKFCSQERIARVTEIVNRHSRVPVIISSDLDRGAGPFIEGATSFPYMMALGATNNTGLARKVGRATAREGRAMGIHWTFSPVVDLNRNFQNPIVNVRALGEDKLHVVRMAEAYIEGIQQDALMAATAKHFPGDGLDDRDQHLCTSHNPLSRPDWDELFGYVWKRVINKGVMSIMAGHIAMPSVDTGLGDYRGPPPATLSYALQTELLKQELGFKGVLVSDAYPMIGFTSHLPTSRLAVENIRTGSDMLLFAEPLRDAKLLLEAYRSKELTEARLDDAVERILTMKHALGILSGRTADPPTEVETCEFSTWSQQVAEHSTSIVRDETGLLPVKLSPGAKVLTVSIGYKENGTKYQDVTVVDEELTRRGYHVTHLANPSHYEILSGMSDYEAIFVNFNIIPHAMMGTVRICDVVMAFWRAFWLEHPRVIFTSFGSPYTLYEMPSIPNFINVYSNTPSSQRAAVRTWFGEIEPVGKSPVSLPGFFTKEV